MRRSVVLCGAVLALASLGPVRADLQSDYLDIYLKMNDAAKLEINGDNRGALAEFEECYTRLHKIHVENPNWENALVTSRLGDCHARILSLEATLAPPPAKASVVVNPAPAASAPAPDSAQARLLTLQAAVKSAPGDAAGWFNLGAAYFQLGQNDPAVDALQRGLALQPTNIYAQNYLGCALLRKGRIESAAKAFQKAIAQVETFAEAHYNLAMLYATEDPPAVNSARAQYKRAIELGIVPDPHLEKLLHLTGR